MNPGLLRLHGEKLWSVVPREWRKWWLRSVTDCIPILSGVTLLNPAPVFVDVSNRRRTLIDGIKSMDARKMRDVCNKHLHAVVRCPFGCGEYFHKCGCVSLDSVVRKMFGRHAVSPVGDVQKLMASDAAVDGMVPDFFSTAMVPKLMGNKEWGVRPSVAFIDGSPRVLCCRQHDGGAAGKHLHLPRNPNGVLCSDTSDQLAPLVTRSHHIRKLKPAVILTK